MTDDSPARQGCDRFQDLLTRALDGALSAEEQAEFDHLLASSPERQKEWNDHRKLKEIAMHMQFAKPPEETWNHYWFSVYNRIERRLAWILVSIGAMIVLFYGGFKAVESILADAHLPAFVRLAILVLLAGGVVLFVSVLREKLFTRKSDPYKEIER